MKDLDEFVEHLIVLVRRGIPIGDLTSVGRLKAGRREYRAIVSFSQFP